MTTVVFRLIYGAWATGNEQFFIIFFRFKSQHDAFVFKEIFQPFLEELMPKKVHSGMNILTLKTENTNVEAQIIDVLDNNLQSFSLLSDIS